MSRPAPCYIGRLRVPLLTTRPANVPGSTGILFLWLSHVPGVEAANGPVSNNITLYLIGTLALLLVLLPGIWLVNRRTRSDPEKEHLVSIIESSDDAIISRELNGRIKSWNRGAEKLYGYSRGEAVGQSIEFVMPEDRHGEIQEFNERVGRGEHIESFESVRLHKDGRRVPVSLSLSPVYDKRGAITGISTIARNIAPRKEAEERLHQATERARFAMESLPVGVIIVDEAGIIRYANPVSARMFGYAEGDGEGGLPGTSLERLVPARMRAHHEGLREEYLMSPVARDMGKGRDLNGVRIDGREFPVEIALTPLPSPGGTRVMTTVVDITERKRAERALELRTKQLERSNRELDSFAYVASHDLKSPLRGIDNLCTWIEEDLGQKCPADVRDHLGLLRSRVARMEGLLEDLLQYSRVGRNNETPQAVDVTRLIDNTVELLDLPPGFTLRIDGEMPVLHTLPTPLEQVFRNLVNNAIKHHDRTSGEIVIGAREVGDFYEFYVSDDGPGIELAYRERIFRMFSTLRPRDEVEGSGLGLAMIAKIVETWHGRVWVEDREGGRGATFKFTWPGHITLDQAEDSEGVN